jgi:hypothetical protein
MVGFLCDGALAMTGKSNGVSEKLKTKLKNSKQRLLSLVSAICRTGYVSMKRMKTHIIPEGRDTVQYSFKLMVMMMILIPYFLYTRIKTLSIVRPTLNF